MQRSYTSLHLHSPIFFLAAEKQSCCAVLAAGRRGSVIWADASSSAIFPPRDFFSQNPPPTEKVSANAITDRPLRRRVRRSGLLLRKRPSHLPPRLRSLFCHITSSATAALHVQDLVEGRDCRTHVLPHWLRQTRPAVVTPASLSVRCRTLYLPHYAGRRTCSLWRCQHSQALRPASCYAFLACGDRHEGHRVVAEDVHDFDGHHVASGFLVSVQCGD
jgi:hypothetical protein